MDSHKMTICDEDQIQDNDDDITEDDNDECETTKNDNSGERR